ncbi:hypothetical protein TNCV_2285161 [Trichonephila clavipes]|nr:hypothetical protein TNCV_2285161 [Trichonephila clavipes]
MSPLSLENKVILYKQILRPVTTYGSPVWGAAATTHMKKIQEIQNKILRVMTNAPCQPRGNSPSSTDQSQCLLSTPAHSKLPWFPPQTLTSSPLLRLASTSASTIFQPANQVASCSPSRTIPLPQATFTIHVMGWRNAPRSMSQ